MSIFTSNADFGSQLRDSFNSWMPGGSFGAAAGGIARGIQGGFSQLGNSMRESMGSWGQQRQPQPFGQQDFQLNDSSARVPFGGRMSGDNMQGNAGGYNDNRFNSAYNQIGQLQRDIQNGRDGNSGQALDYFGRQEKQQKISELYKNTQNFDGETQRQLAQVQDEWAKRKAQKDLANPRLYNGVANTNEMLQNEARAKWGVGALQTYADGGRIGWGAGNQQGENLREAAKMGVPVSGMLMDKGNFDANIFDQGNAIYNPEAGSAADPFTWLGHSSYNTMGIGANNTSDVAYGAGGVWNPAQWGSHFEEGGGYDWGGGAQGQWNKFHKNNLSYGGGNFIGDSNYGKSSKAYDFQGPTFGGPSVGGQASPSYDGKLSSGMVPYWRSQGYSPAQIDQLIQQNGGTLPPRAHVPTNGPYGDTQNEQKAANDYYGKLVGGGYKPEVSSDYVKQMQKFLENSNSRFSGMGEQLQRITSPAYDAPSGGAVGSGRLSTSLGNDVFNEPVYYPNYGMPPVGEEQFKWIDNFARDRGVNPDAYKPSRPSRVSSYNDVFDQGNYGSSYRQAARQGDYQRMTSPYYNFADGFDNGYYGVQNDSTFGMGNYRPKSFWRTK